MSPRQWLRGHRPRRGPAREARRTAYKDLGVLPVCGGSLRPLASQRGLAARR